MRAFKHAILSLVRKPSKAVMILVIMVLVFSLVFTGIIIKNSIGKSKEFIRTQLGAVVQFEPDYIKAMEDNIGEKEYQKMIISRNVAEDIGSDSRVKRIYLIENAFMTAPGLKSGMNQGGDGDGFSVYTQGDSMFGDGPMVNLSGSNNRIPLEFEIDKLALSSGRHITETELSNGEKVILVSDEFAAVNNLEPGDTIGLKMFEGEKADFTIVGTFSGAEQFAEDNVFTSSNAIQELNSNDPYMMEGLASVYFVLKNPMDVDDFIKDNIEKLPSEYTKLTANEDEYNKLTKPLELMEIITTILIWVIFIAGALIIISIVTIFIRDRKFEIGLLLSSGESKLKIAFQYIFEIAIVALLAFLLSAGASQLTSNYVGGWIAENQLIEEKTETNMMGGSVFMIGEKELAGDVDIDSVAEEFDVSVDFNTIVNLFLISMLIMVIAAGTPLMIILRYKPREALQD